MTTRNDKIMPFSTTTILQQKSNVPSVVEYLEEILDNVKKCSNDKNTNNNDDDDGIVSLTITQKHVKTMIRCLLGLTKIEFTEQLRKFQIQQDWKDIQRFIEETHGPALLDMLLENSNKQEKDDLMLKAPNLLDGLTNYKQIFDPTKSTFSKQKVFAYLSRGRTYQGKFERLLQEWIPDLLPSYQTQFMPDSSCDDYSSISSSSSISKENQQLLHDFVLSRVQELEHQKQGQETSNKNNDENNKNDEDDEESQSLSNAVLRQALLDCINIEFPPAASSQPIDGGKANGKKSELDLVTYLTMQHRQQAQSTPIIRVPGEDDDGNLNDDDFDTIVDNNKTTQASTKTKNTIRILAPVYIVHNARKIKNKGKCPYVLEILTSSSMNNTTTRSKNIGNNGNINNALFGMTSEWDAVVVEIIENHNNATTTPSTSTNSTVARVLEVWESKSSLHSGTINDALQKKYNSITQLFGSDEHDDDNNNTNPHPSLRLWVGNESFPVVGGDTDGNNLPRIGIFGASLWNPSQASKHYQTTMLEEYFQRNPKIVIEYALKANGKIPASIAALGIDDYQSAIIEPLEKLVERARIIQPRLVVATAKEGDDSEGDTKRMDKKYPAFE